MCLYMMRVFQGWCSIEAANY